MRLLTGYARPVVALAVTPSGSLVSAAKKMSHLWEWDADTGKVVAKHPPPKGVGRGGWDVLETSPTGGYFVALQDLFFAARWTFNDKPPRKCAIEGDLGPYPDVSTHPTQVVFAVTIRRHLKSGGYSYGYQLIDSGTGRYREWRRVGPDPVVALAFSPDGSRLAVASQDYHVRLFDPETNRLAATALTKNPPTRLSFNRANGDLAVACGRNVVILRGSELKQIAEFRPHAAVARAMAYSPDGKYLATAANDGVVVLRDGATFALAGRRHLDIGELACLCWRDDSSSLYAGGNKVIASCDLADIVGEDRRRPKNIEPLSLAGHKRKVTLLGYAPDGRTLYSGDGRELIAWDMSGGAGQAKRREGFSPPTNARVVSASPDGRRLVLCDDTHAVVCDAATGATERVPATGNVYSLSAAFAPTGELFVRETLADARSLEIRDAETGAVVSASRLSVTEYGYDTTQSMPVYASGGRVAYFVSGGRAVVRWDRDAGGPTRVVESAKFITFLDVSPDGRRLATAMSADVMIHDLVGGGKPRRLKHPLKVSGLGFVPDGRLVTASADGVVRVWDAVRGAELYAFELGMGRVYCLAVSPDGMTFAAGVHKRKAVVLMDVPE